MDWSTGIVYICPIQKDCYTSNSIIAFEIIIGIFKLEMLLGDNILLTGYISIK